MRGYTHHFSATDNRLVTEAFNDLNASVPAVQAQWAEYNQVYLGNYNLDSYQIMTNFPVNTLADLDGRKIGGAGPNLAWLQGTGAVGVATTGPQVYNALKTGLYEGILLPISLLKVLKLDEVATHLTIVDFGAINGGAITINMRKWDSLPAEVQQALRKGGDAFREESIGVRDEILTGALKVLVDGGTLVSTLDPSVRETWAASIPNLAGDWAAGDADKQAVVESLMATYRASGAEMARDWDK